METQSPKQYRERTIGFSPVSGIPQGPEKLRENVLQTVEDAAKALQCSHMAAVAHVPTERLVCGVLAVGYQDERFREWGIALEQAGAIAEVVQTGKFLFFEASPPLPPPLSERFCERVVLVPLIFGDEVLAVLIGQVRPGVDTRARIWQEKVQDISARVGLLVELQRLMNAYMEELQRRQYLRDVISAILEERSLSEVGQMLTEMVAQRFNVDMVGLFLKEGPQIRPVALRNISPELGRDIARIASTSVRPRAVASTIPIYRTVRSGFDWAPELQRRLEREGIKAAWMAMLQQGRWVFGALVVYLREERAIAPADNAAFQGFADIAMLGIAMSKQIEQQRQLATIEERARLGREMHDTVARSLGALVLTLETAQNFLNGGKTVQTVPLIEAALVHARKALEDTRRAIDALSPPELEGMSLAELIAQELQTLEQAGMITQFVLGGEERSLNREQNMALLRITQEALNNALRHSQAQRVRVGLIFGVDEVSLRIEDDGVGFDPEARTAPGPQGGYGLFGMQERARAVGGTVEVQSTPGWGTSVVVRLPYEPPQAEGASLQSVRKEPSLSSTLLPAVRETDAAMEGKASTSTQADVLRVLIVDDHPLTRQGIRSVLGEGETVQIVSEAGDVEEALTQAKALRPDVVLLDVQMPGGGGLVALERLRETLPELTVVMLASLPTEEEVSAALRLGARGFLLKDATPGELIASIKAAYRGETVLSAALTRWLTELASGRKENAADFDLTERELEILRLVAKGARNKEIASTLFIAPKTVEHYLSNIFVKLNVSNRTEAVRLAIERGLI